MQQPAALRTHASTGAAWRIAPFAALIAFLILEQTLRASPWRDALDLRWVTVARGLVVGGVLAAGWRRFRELRSNRLRVGELMLAMIAGLAVFGLWIALDANQASPMPAPVGFVPLDAQGRLEPSLAFLRSAGFALAVPLAEELFWRSFLLRWIDRKRFLELDPRAASPKAFAICSALFALEHSMWLAGLAAGIVYTALYKKTGNLWAPIVSHAITNAALATWILATARWALW